MNFLFPFLFGFIGVAVVYFIDWGANKKPSAAWPYYAAAVLVLGVLAYFIDERVVRALIMLAAGFGVAWALKGIKRFSTPNP